jgi:hypothetical protein
MNDVTFTIGLDPMSLSVYSSEDLAAVGWLAGWATAGLAVAVSAAVSILGGSLGAGVVDGGGIGEELSGDRAIYAILAGS